MTSAGGRVMPYADPLRAGRHPFQVYMLTLALVSGAPLIFGRGGAEAIEDGLPPWMAVVWGVFLFAGSAIGLVGVYWRGSYATALTLERIGLDLAGSAAMVYGLLILEGRWPSSIVSGAIILAFGVACIRRARDLAAVVRRAIAESPPTVAREGETDSEVVDRREGDHP